VPFEFIEATLLYLMLAWHNRAGVLLMGDLKVISTLCRIKTAVLQELLAVPSPYFIVIFDSFSLCDLSLYLWFLLLLIVTVAN